MKAGPEKCAVGDCARGVRTRGYCNAHALRLKRGMDLSAPFRPRGRSVRASTVEECATIAEFHGHPDLAALYRKLMAPAPRNARQTNGNGSNSSEVEDSKE